MMDKKKSSQQHIPKKVRIEYFGSQAQRMRLLEHMRQNGFITTITARIDLNVMMLAARIKELRDSGSLIKTLRVASLGDQRCIYHGVELNDLIQVG